MGRVKKEPGSSSNGGTKSSERELRSSKRNAVDAISNNINNDQQNEEVEEQQQQQQRDGDVEEEEEEVVDDDVSMRRALRSRYLAVKNLLSGGRDDAAEVDLDSFKTIINEVESLHQKVQRPREQVADAEALLDITTSFVKSVKAQKNDGVTPSDFVTCVLRDFGRQGRATSSIDGVSNVILWKDIGLAVSHIFRQGAGYCTMLGPMGAEMKRRKSVVRKKHVKPTETARPEELNTIAEEKTDTDKNMSTMFGILRKNRRVQLEYLVLNRKSFAQSIENLFALSFLVKDGRAEITANEKGHFVSPRNAPAAEAITSGKVTYSHFVFRLDFKDWKLMLDTVEEGKELMPHRVQVDTSAASPQRHEADASACSPQRHEAAGSPFRVQAESAADSELSEDTVPAEPETAATTPIRKLSRNRGLVIQEQTIVANSPESDDSRARAAYIRKGKRKLM